MTLDARLEPDGWNGTLATERRCVRLREIRSVWYRHPSHFVLPEGMSRPECRHAAAEARVGVAGVLCSLEALWVNYPSREADALKPRQLDVARRCGLRIPRSLVTNTAVGVRNFAAVVGGPLAGKNLSAASLVESNHLQTAYTRKLGPTELADLSGVETTAHLFSNTSRTRRSRSGRPWSVNECSRLRSTPVLRLRGSISVPTTRVSSTRQSMFPYLCGPGC